ncbi:hypothetical protein D4764_12G0001600 [Takifugu flavidus]|uniref:Uncharacterized protein n=1 Tax=Takifugu flavidus TaxID=433684 RepID=A0A5C6PEZ8_9TELE|nr:hypothetical protein D4764_12G0001600 [Takifugu flavidus]
MTEKDPHLGHISDTEFQSQDCKDDASRAQKTLTEAVKDILNDQPENISLNSSNMSEFDYQLLKFSTAKDLQKVASEISAEIVQSKSRLDSQANSNCWKMVEERLKAFSFCKYVKESILQLWAALKTKYNHSSNQEEGLQKVLEKGELLVESMSKIMGARTLDEKKTHQEVFQNVFNNFDTEEHKEICNQLSDIIFQHVGTERNMKNDINKHVDAFIKDMYSFAQAQTQQQDHGVVKMALERIEEATDSLSISSLQLPKESLTIESDEDDADSLLPSLDPFEERNRISSNLAVQLTCEILGNLLPHVPAMTLKDIISKMKTMLMKEFESVDVPLTITEDHIGRTVKAVLKELRKKMGRKGWIRLNFLLGNQYDLIIESTMTHLRAPQENNKFITFFKNIFKFRA